MNSGRATLLCRTLLLVPLLFASACATLGPDFQQPDAPRPADWNQDGGDVLNTAAPEVAQWWKVFNDPVLDSLVTTASRQNLTLQIAGLRKPGPSWASPPVPAIHSCSSCAAPRWQPGSVKTVRISIGQSTRISRITSLDLTPAGKSTSGGASSVASRLPTPTWQPA